MMNKIKNFMMGFGIMTSIILVMILCCVGKENMFKKERKLDRSEIVEEIIFREYYSGNDKDQYNFKCYWKNDELLYVTVENTSHYEICEGNYRYMCYVALFDKDLNLVKGLGGYNPDYVWEEIYQLAEGL